MKCWRKIEEEQQVNGHLADGVPLVVAHGHVAVLTAQRKQVLGTPAAARDPLGVFTCTAKQKPNPSERQPGLLLLQLNASVGLTVLYMLLWPIVVRLIAPGHSLHLHGWEHKSTKNT